MANLNLLINTISLSQDLHKMSKKAGVDTLELEVRGAATSHLLKRQYTIMHLNRISSFLFLFAELSCKKCVPKCLLYSFILL